MKQIAFWDAETHKAMAMMVPAELLGQPEALEAYRLAHITEWVSLLDA